MWKLIIEKDKCINSYGERSCGMKRIESCRDEKDGEKEIRKIKMKERKNNGI